MALFGRKKDAVTTPDADTIDEIVPEPVAAVVPQRSLEEQRDFLLAAVEPLRPFGMNIWDVPGLTLCEDIASDLDLPLVTTARIAGWGVRGSDLVGASSERPVSLYVVDSIAEGEAPGAPLVAGAAVKVAEGAILPEGVDVVVAAADGVREGDHVRIAIEGRLHQHIRRAGSELADGTPLLHAGEVLTPRSVAVLAEVGLDKVLVRPRPRIVVFTVGDSLVAPGQALTAPQQRYDSSTALVTAAARADGATVYPLGIVESRPEAIRGTIADQQIRADLIVVVGGGDLVREVMSGLGEFDEADVAINRATRYGFVSLGAERVPAIMLPGAGVSAYVGYHAFVRPVINRLNDVDPMTSDRVEGVVADELPATEGVTEYVPAWRDEDGTVRPVATDGSELAYNLARANVLMVIPAEWGGVAEGSRVECLVLDDTHGPAPTR